MDHFEKPDQLPAQESFSQIAESFNITTPQQLRDQVIWQGIRRILMLLDTSDDGLAVTRAQDRLFNQAQRAEADSWPRSETPDRSGLAAEDLS